MPFGTLIGQPLTSAENFTKIVSGKPLSRGFQRKGVAKYSDFIERELTFTFAICHGFYLITILYAIAVPSVVCLSVVSLSVTLVRPTQPVETFDNFTRSVVSWPSIDAINQPNR